MWFGMYRFLCHSFFGDWSNDTRRVLRVEVVPALLFNIPGDGQALQAPPRERDQVLLKRGVPECVFDFKIFHFTVRPLCVNEELFVLAKETGPDAFVFKNRIIEITQDGFVVSYIHSQVMVGILPVLIFLFVTIDAFVAAYKGHERSRNRLLGLTFDISPFKGVDRNR